MNKGQRIGTGTRSHIHLTEDGNHAYKAFKHFPKDMLSDEVIREISIINSLKDCPHIVKIKKVVITDNTCGFVMKKYVGSLRDKKVDFALAKKIFYQLLVAVHHAHSRFVIHRDIKPDNVLIDEENNIVLIDWGLSLLEKYYLDEPKLLEVQTVNYRAPEIFLGDEFYTNKIDVWSCALVYFQLITGNPLFGTLVDIDKIKMVINYFNTLHGKTQDIDYESAIGCNVIDYFFNKLSSEDNAEIFLTKDLLNNMLQIEPTKRFSTLDALKHDFFQDMNDTYKDPNLDNLEITNLKKFAKEYSLNNANALPNAKYHQRAIAIHYISTLKKRYDGPSFFVAMHIMDATANMDCFNKTEIDRQEILLWTCTCMYLSLLVTDAASGYEFIYNNEGENALPITCREIHELSLKMFAHLNYNLYFPTCIMYIDTITKQAISSRNIQKFLSAYELISRAIVDKKFYEYDMFELCLSACCISKITGATKMIAQLNLDAPYLEPCTKYLSELK